MIFKKSSYRLRHIWKYNKGTHLLFVSKPLIKLYFDDHYRWVHGSHCTFIYIWTFICLHMSEHKKKWKIFEFLYKNIGHCGSYHYDLYIIHMLQAKLLNVALKYYNKEKNANGWILKNSTHPLVATISKFKLQGKYFKRKALKTYILQGITCKFKK